jgi:hypothetical protein
VELQTSTQKVSLPFKSKVDFVETFESDQKFDGVVEYDVKELGNHMYCFFQNLATIFYFPYSYKFSLLYILYRLICVVNYSTEKGEKMNFKKFYKFAVSKPFEIQPRFPFFDVKVVFFTLFIFIYAYLFF